MHTALSLTDADLLLPHAEEMHHNINLIFISFLQVRSGTEPPSLSVISGSSFVPK